jgi:lysophospholipase L1-like esterase
LYTDYVSFPYRTPPKMIIFFTLLVSTFTEQDHILQEMLGKKYPSKSVEVINTGVSATTARNHLATIVNILNYEPDIIIILMGGNDWHYHIKISQNPKELSPNLISRIRNHIPVALMENLATLRTATRFDNTLIAELYKKIRSKFKTKENSEGKTLYQNFAGGTITTMMGSLNRPEKREFYPKQVLPTYKYLVSRIGNLCKNNSINCIFANQPTAYKKAATDEMKSRFWVTPMSEVYTLSFDSLVHVARIYNEYLPAYANKNKHTGCELSNQIDPTLEYFWDDLHFTIKGANKVGEVIFGCVMKTLATHTD